MKSGWANHIEPTKGTRRRICRMWTRLCQSQCRGRGAILVWYPESFGGVSCCESGCEGQFRCR